MLHKIILYIIENIKFFGRQTKRQFASIGRRIMVTLHMVLCVFTDGSAPEDYIWLQFYNKSFRERKAFFTLVRQRMLCRKINGPEVINIMNHKEIFDETFGDLLGREYLFADTASKSEIAEFVEKHQTIIVKPISGSQGKNVYKLSAPVKKYDRLQNCILEEVLHQHEILAEFNPNSVNTLRVSSICKNGKALVFSATLRMGTSEAIIDNAGAGGIFAQVDVDTGKVFTDAVNEDCMSFKTNPYSGKTIKGVQLPYWDEVKVLVTKAALRLPGSSLIGWDVAVTPDGPVLIEGNDHQNTAVMQMASQMGKYEVVRAFLRQLNWRKDH